jgi:hopanoid biosynthesis associated RND transporter like protein HpnN
MNEPLQRFLTPHLQRWLGFVSANARSVSSWCVVATLVALVYALLNLGINADNLSLISDTLQSRKNQAEFAAHFPNLEEAILIVIDGQTPADARDATNALAEELQRDPEAFKNVYVPGGGEFFEDHALLYSTPETLDRLADDMATLQPVLASLEADPSLVELAELVRTALEAGTDQGIDSGQWTRLLDEVGRATVSVYEEIPVRISWETMLIENSDLEIPTRRVIVVDPFLEYQKILVASVTLARIEDAVRSAGVDRMPGVTVRMTGNPALNHEEMLGLAWDIGGSAVFCFLLVAGFLYFAFRSWRLVIGSLGTLLVGLVWTGAFAAATIGELNMISIAFAILFIGLGVDFAIHFGMAFAAERRDHSLPTEAALHKAIDGIGASLVLCGFTTAIGFLVFIPAEYKGVAELGAIAGAGMFIILILTLTLFPALLTGWLRIPDDVEVQAPTRLDQAMAMRVARMPRVVCAVALLTALAAAPLLFELRFDAHVIEMRDPDTTSVQAFRDLLSDIDSSPWYANVMAPNLDATRAIEERLAALPEVGRTVSLRSYVPEDQEEKLLILEDLAFMMEAPPRASPDRPVYTIGEQVEALRLLRHALSEAERPADDLAVVTSLDSLEARLAAFLERIDDEADPERAVTEFRDILLAQLPEAMARFRNSLSVSAIEFEKLPPELVRRMLAPDGTARIQAFPAEELQDFESLKRFASSVLAVAPKAAGIAPNLVDFGEATARSFRLALISAALAISVLLFVLWRRPGDVLIVLSILGLGSLLTCASMVLLGLSFNFANVLVLPLLFGIGVDSGIHLVHRARYDAENPADTTGSLVETATAGAVFYSAMTTTLSFGTLALSGHQGMHGLGVMLTIGMFWTIVANLVVLPALLEVVGIVPEPNRASNSTA